MAPACTVGVRHGFAVYAHDHYFKDTFNISTKSLTTRQLAKVIAGFASDKKAGDIVLLDMRKVANFCDYFVICSGNTDRQVKAIAEGIKQGLKDFDINLKHKERDKNAQWLLLDLGDVVTHIFEKDTREFYGLEYLWREAKPVSWQ